MENVIDYYETLAEELSLNGFDVEVVKDGFNYQIEIDTMAGKLIYIRAFDNYMKDYYRFIRIYGTKLGQWAFDNQHLQDKK